MRHNTAGGFTNGDENMTVDGCTGVKASFLVRLHSKRMLGREQSEWAHFQRMKR